MRILLLVSMITLSACANTGSPFLENRGEKEFACHMDPLGAECPRT